MITINLTSLVAIEMTYFKAICNSLKLCIMIKNVLGTGSHSLSEICLLHCVTLLHSERPKLYSILAFLSALGLSGMLLCGDIFVLIKAKLQKLFILIYMYTLPDGSFTAYQWELLCKGEKQTIN